MSGELVPLAPGQSPLQWQSEAMLSIRKYLPQYSDILISAATGTGKGTMIASLVVKAFRAGKRTLFLVHRDELIDDVMSRAIEIEPRLSAGKVKGKINEWAALAVFASVQTLRGKRLADVGRFDFFITDEAHHAVAPSYLNVYKRVREINERAKHIGFTATPFRSGRGGKTSGVGDAFKILCYEYSLQQAITDGVLCPITCIQIETHLDLTGVDPDDEDALERIIDTPDRNRIVAEKYREHLNGKPAIVFGVSIAHARNMAAALVDQGVRAEAVWGVDKERKRKIDAFKAGAIQVLCNKDLLTEGFNYPAVEGVLLNRPTESRGLFAQMIGRATRRSPGKDCGKVLDFVANSATHDLESTRNLGKKEEAQRIEVGAVVRHKRIADLCEGTVTELTGDGLKASVIWKGFGLSDRDGWFPCELLVLLRPPRAESELSIVPSVAGVTEFEVLLFGDGPRKVAWYTYDSSTRGKIRVARGQGMSVIVLRDKVGRGEPAQDGTGRDAPGQWGAWTHRDRVADRIATGEYGPVFATACSAVENPMPWDSDWQGDPATERQIEVLRKFNVKREKLSKGEACMLLEVKFGILAIDRAASGGGASQ